MEKEQTQSTKPDLAARPPIVVVMGHIDHGKTTLLDYIRKASVAAKETGGITQHIGAYQAECAGKRITFLDTPGHEAFSKMRSRGAKVADIAVLVVAADDGVKPQTKEAISAIKDAKVDFCVAINKIDKPSADAERAKNDLADAEVFLEGRGGNVPYAEISAKTGAGVDKLLETILLMAEVMDLKGDSSASGEGVVIESHLDPKRGITSTLLLRNGSLKKGEFVSAGGTVAKVKIFEDYTGKAIDAAGPSDPVRVIGFDKLPEVGVGFRAFKTQGEAIEAAYFGKTSHSSTSDVKSPKTSDVSPSDVEEKYATTIGIVIKTDVSGSAEAISHEIEKLKNEKVELKILRAEAGDVSEDDVKTAAAAIVPLVLAFRVNIGAAAKELAERMKVEIAESKIIYELTDFLKKRLEELAPKEEKNKILGRAKILKIFPAKGAKGQVVGGKVLEGVVKRGASFNLLRRENKIGEGRIDNLQSGRLNAAEVSEGNEFGALAGLKVTVAVGDILEIIM